MIRINKKIGYNLITNATFNSYPYHRLTGVK
jgi:hypothetical protein